MLRFCDFCEEPREADLGSLLTGDLDAVLSGQTSGTPIA